MLHKKLLLIDKVTEQTFVALMLRNILMVLVTKEFLNYNCVKDKIISNAFSHHGLCVRTPRETPLLKNKHVKACLKFTEQHLDKPVKYWKKICENRRDVGLFYRTVLASFI